MNLAWFAELIGREGSSFSLEPAENGRHWTLRHSENSAQDIILRPQGKPTFCRWLPLWRKRNDDRFVLFISRICRSIFCCGKAISRIAVLSIRDDCRSLWARQWDQRRVICGLMRRISVITLRNAGINLFRGHLISYILVSTGRYCTQILFPMRIRGKFSDFGTSTPWWGMILFEPQCPMKRAVDGNVDVGV